MATLDNSPSLFEGESWSSWLNAVGDNQSSGKPIYWISSLTINGCQKMSYNTQIIVLNSSEFSCQHPESMSKLATVITWFTFITENDTSCGEDTSKIESSSMKLRKEGRDLQMLWVTIYNFPNEWIAWIYKS